MIERHYFKGRLLRSYDFNFGFVIPGAPPPHVAARRQQPMRRAGGARAALPLLPPACAPPSLVPADGRTQDPLTMPLRVV